MTQPPRPSCPHSTAVAWPVYVERRRWRGCLVCLLRGAHESDRMPVRVRDHGKPRPPERVVRRLLRRVTGACQVEVDVIDLLPRVHSEHQDDPRPTGPALVPDRSELLAVEIDVPTLLAAAVAVVRRPLRRRR